MRSMHLGQVGDAVAERCGTSSTDWLYTSWRFEPSRLALATTTVVTVIVLVTVLVSVVVSDLQGAVSAERLHHF